MKKYFLLLILPFLFLTNVKADVTQSININGFNNEYSLLSSTLTFSCLSGDCSLQQTYNEKLSYYENNLKNIYPYYTFEFQYFPDGSSFLELYLSTSNSFTYEYIESNNNIYHWVKPFEATLVIDGGSYTVYTTNEYTFAIFGGYETSGTINQIYSYFDSNINFYVSGDYVIDNFYSSDSLVLSNNSIYPKIKDLMQYNSWNDYENNHLENYTEVNLDNYEYVLLSLKNYNQTDAFQTNFQVKGQIGITPIYNYGQTSKDSITGSQVQDRCNVSYSNYTSYPFYILQNDLQNNVVYAVKECSQGSSFKFDNTVFDITYVTQSNLNDPTIVINGNTYHTIPYSDLPSTATKNEEDNYIPGESENIINSNTGGLDSAIKNVQQKMSEIWNTFSYFTDFIGQIFSSLPDELHTVLLSAFVIAILLGLIKIFIN